MIYKKAVEKKCTYRLDFRQISIAKGEEFEPLIHGLFTIYGYILENVRFMHVEALLNFVIMILWYIYVYTCRHTHMHIMSMGHLIVYWNGSQLHGETQSLQTIFIIYICMCAFGYHYRQIHCLACIGWHQTKHKTPHYWLCVRGIRVLVYSYQEWTVMPWSHMSGIHRWPADFP